MFSAPKTTTNALSNAKYLTRVHNVAEITRLSSRAPQENREHRPVSDYPAAEIRVVLVATQTVGVVRLERLQKVQVGVYMRIPAVSEHM